MLIISILNPLFYGLGLMNSLKWFKKKMYYVQKNANITQEEVNKMSEPRELDISKKYANTVLLILVSLTYMYLFPFILVVGLWGTGLQYFVKN